MTKIKICGMMSQQDIEYVNKALPDYIGFVFANGRRRYITPHKAFELKQLLDTRIKAVGVFVNESESGIMDIVRMNIIDMIQLHGDESDVFTERIKAVSGLPVIKAFSVSNSGDVAFAESSCADYILFDNGIGGTGSSFDWELLRGVKRPFFLAGGINSSNIRMAVNNFAPYCVDVSSGAETNGRKDPNKIRELMLRISKR